MQKDQAVQSLQQQNRIQTEGLLGEAGRTEREVGQRGLEVSGSCSLGEAPWPAGLMPAVGPLSQGQVFVLHVWAGRAGRQWTGGSWAGHCLPQLGLFSQVLSLLPRASRLWD